MHPIWHRALDLSNAACQYLHMMHLKTARAYVRALHAWSEDDQAKVVSAYAKTRGWSCTVIRESVEGRDVWLRFLRSSKRRHVALLPSLHVLAVPSGSGADRPLVDFTLTLSELQRISPLIVDALADATSADAAAFAAATRKAAARIAKGRKLPRKQARKMAARRWPAGKKHGLPGVWSEPWISAENARHRDVWRSHSFTTDAAALAAVNTSLMERELQDLVIGSTATARRIFGGRRKR